MSRKTGVSTFSGNFEVRYAEPLDARSVVDSRSDLTLLDTWSRDGNAYTYKGMLVSVVNDPVLQNNGLYQLVNIDYTQEGSWVQQRSGAEIWEADSQVFDDWFLPSTNELQAIWRNLCSDGVLESTGINGAQSQYALETYGFDSANYWTSTENTNVNAWALRFLDGELNSGRDKSYDYRVRFVRSFTSVKSYKVRDKGPAGGWIFHVDMTIPAVPVYYEVEPIPIPLRGAKFSNIYNVLIGTTAVQIGQGKLNTQKIIGQAGHIASGAKQADDYSMSYSNAITDIRPTGDKQVRAEHISGLTIEKLEDVNSVDREDGLPLVWDAATKTHKYALPDAGLVTLDTDQVITGHKEFTQVPTVGNRIYAIGELGPAGGIVIYDKGDEIDGWRYIEVLDRASDQGVWSDFYSEVGGLFGGYGSGFVNTPIIVSSTFPANGSAVLCSNFESGLFTDWYLPSVTELGALYNALGYFSFLPQGEHWASENLTNTGAFYDLGVGASSYAHKGQVKYIAPFRRFLSVPPSPVNSGDLVTVDYLENSAFVNLTTDQSVAGVKAFSSLPLATADLAIGSVGPAGGTIIYDKGDDTNGWRYLELGPADLPDNIWSNIDTLAVIGSSDAIGSGLFNTTLMGNQPGALTGSWRSCLDYSYGGYDDWYLPSIFELKEAYTQRAFLDPGLLTKDYWSSTQSDSNPMDGAKAFMMTSGIIGSSMGKNNSFGVRPIRRFVTGLILPTDRKQLTTKAYVDSKVYFGLGNPSVDNDEEDTAGIGRAFVAGDFWIAGSLKFICMNSSPSSAVWDPIVGGSGFKRVDVDSSYNHDTGLSIGTTAKWFPRIQNYFNLFFFEVIQEGAPEPNVGSDLTFGDMSELETWIQANVTPNGYTLLIKAYYYEDMAKAKPIMKGRNFAYSLLKSGRYFSSSNRTFGKAYADMKWLNKDQFIRDLFSQLYTLDVSGNEQGMAECIWYSRNSKKLYVHHRDDYRGNIDQTFAQNKFGFTDAGALVDLNALPRPLSFEIQSSSFWSFNRNGNGPATYQVIPNNTRGAAFFNDAQSIIKIYKLRDPQSGTNAIYIKPVGVDAFYVEGTSSIPTSGIVGISRGSKQTTFQEIMHMGQYIQNGVTYWFAKNNLPSDFYASASIVRNPSRRGMHKVSTMIRYNFGYYSQETNYTSIVPFATGVGLHLMI